MQPESGLRTWQWVVTAIVIIVLIVIGIMVFGKKTDTDGTPDGGTNATSTVTNTPGTNSIVMSDQYPGNVAYISSVQVAQGAWVEIHKDNSGQPGAIIGSAWVDAGINPVKITLTEAMIDGRTYYAMLHSDDGDKKFDATKDLPLKDSNGNIVTRIFKATVTADQNIKG